MKKTWLLITVIILAVACKNIEQEDALQSDQIVESSQEESIDTNDSGSEPSEKTTQKIPVEKDLEKFDLSKTVKHLELADLTLGMSRKAFDELNIKANQNFEEKTKSLGGYSTKYHQISKI